MDMRGQQHPSGHLVVTSEEIRECRSLLAEHGISFPSDDDRVPLWEKPPQPWEGGGPPGRLGYPPRIRI
jgi:hypothetical protein